MMLLDDSMDIKRDLYNHSIASSPAQGDIYIHVHYIDEAKASVWCCASYSRLYSSRYGTYYLEMKFHYHTETVSLTVSL